MNIGATTSCSASSSSAVQSPSGLSAAQLRKEIAALQQAENVAKSAQQKASDAASLQQYQAQLAQVQKEPSGGAAAASSSQAPRGSSTGTTGQLVDTEM